QQALNSEPCLVICRYRPIVSAILLRARDISESEYFILPPVVAIISCQVSGANRDRVGGCFVGDQSDICAELFYNNSFFSRSSLSCGMILASFSQVLTVLGVL